MLKRVWIILLLFAIESGCNQNIPKPKNINNLFEIKAAASTINVSDRNFSVKTFVKQNDVYVECFLKDYQLSSENGKDLAKIRVTIDEKRHSEQNTAAFIIKNLSNGRHILKIDILNGNGENTGLSQEFEIHIQSTI